jgi:hypothetical protein
MNIVCVGVGVGVGVGVVCGSVVLKLIWNERMYLLKRWQRLLKERLQVIRHLLVQ